MDAGATKRTGAPPRLYAHKPATPYLELPDDPLSEKAPKPIRHAHAHWQRHYSRRERQHGELLERWKGRAVKGQERTILQNKFARSELHETVARLCMWMLVHCDVKSRWVGKPSRDAVRPYDLEEIAEALRRPGEQAIPLSTLCRALGRMAAARYIWRWQGRDREVDDDGVEYWRGKVAVLRLTERFWRLSGGAWQVRERWLDKKKSQARRRELDEPTDAFAAFFARWRSERGLEDTWENHSAADREWKATKPPPPKH